MRIFKVIIFFILSSWFALSAMAIERYSFYKMKDEEQFSPNNITTLLQDRFGFIWIGTTEGLYRYNGLEYETYVNQPTRASSLPSNHITALLEDSDSGLWVGTAQGELVFIDADYQNFEFKYKIDEDSISALRSLHQTREEIIIAAYESALVILDSKRNTIKKIERENPSLTIAGLELDDDTTMLRSSEPILMVAEDKANNTYILLGDKIYNYNLEEDSFSEINLSKLLKDKASDIYFTCFYIDNDNSLWIGTETHGLLHYQPNYRRLALKNDPKQTEYQVLRASKINTIVRGDENKLWLGTEKKGLFLLDISTDQLHHFETNQFDQLSLESKFITSIIQDKRGTLWLGSKNLGLLKSPLKDRKIGRITRHRQAENGLIGNIIYGIERQDNTWFIASAGGITEFDEVTGLFKQYSSQDFPQQGSIFLIEPVGKNYLWYAIETDQGVQTLYLWDKRKNLHQQVSMTSEDGKILTQISLLESDLDGFIWVSTNLGLHQFFPTATVKCRDAYSEQENTTRDKDKAECINQVNASWERYFIDSITSDNSEAQSFSSFQQEEIRTMYDSGDDYWFGTQIGLVRFNKPKKEFRFFSNDRNLPKSISSNTIYHITEDRNGNLWLATANGINELSKENRNKNINDFNAITESYLKFGGVFRILFDNQGLMWLSTTKGLFRYNHKTKDTRLYNRYDGMNSDVFAQNAGVETKQGDLLFGSKSGIAVVLSDVKRLKLEPANIIIRDIKVRNRQLQIAPWHSIKPLKLSANDNDFTAYFTQTDYNQPSRNKFEYRLKGFKDSSWITEYENPFAIYTNIPPGDYVFEVRSAMESVSNIASYPFIVETPLHLRWWSILAYIIIISFSIYYFISRQQARLLEQQKINEQLNRLDQLKDEFLANTSHELRTPLNGIIGLAESLLEGVTGELSQKTREHLRLIVQSGNRLAQLVNEILDFKKISYNNLQLDLSSIYLYPFVQIVYTSCLPLVKNKAIKIINKVPKDIVAVDADSDRLQQILYNLVDNAIKYTESGTVTISAEVAAERVYIKVADSGVGIESKDIKRIFEPFEQLEESSTKQYTGTGLGLAITKQLVDLHGSKLQVDSTPGKGSVFYFSLPISKQKPNQAIDIVEDLSPQLTSKLARRENDIKDDMSMTLDKADASPIADKITVFIVDDEPVNRRIMMDILSLQGYQVIEARDGEEAVDIIASPDTPHLDLLILDVMMPKLSGFDVCKEVRKKYSSIELPILMVSAKARADDITTGLEAGANDYITKPIDRQEFIARVHTLVMLREVGEARKEKQRVTTLEHVITRLGKYFPKSIAEKILTEEDGNLLAPNRRMITVIFADLAEFTTLTDRCEPEVIVNLLNEYLTAMGELVEAHNGTLNEILGDGLVVLFGAPDKIDKLTQIESSIALSIAMQKKMLELSKKWLEDGIDHHVQLRIGIHQDFATVGNIGSKDFLAYRAVGSAINLASRLQAESSPGGVVVSYPLYVQTKDKFKFLPLQEKVFKGFVHPHRFCQVVIE